MGGEGLGRGGRTALRWALYLLGLLILALGLTLNARLGLGSTPILSVPLCVSGVVGATLGDAVLVWYVVLILVQMVLQLIRGERDKLLRDALQFPLSLIFTRVMNGLAALLPAFEGAEKGLAGRIVLLAFSILLVGVGAALSLDMRLIPNPGDGVVQTIADFAGKPVGTTKNCFDLGCVALAVLTSLVLTGGITGVGLGTVAAALGVGRVVALFNRLAGERLKSLLPQGK